jgi:PGF-pre-PGF domain-containing protein
MTYLLAGIIMISMPTIVLAQEVTIELTSDNAVVTIPSISKGTIAIIDLPVGESGFTVRSLEISTAEQVDGVELTIDILDEKPMEVGEVNGRVHQYLSIISKNLELDDLASAKVSFAIPKTWLDDNNIKTNTVGLLGVFEGQWSIQPTQEVEDNAEEVIFTTELPNLSFINYAIAGDLPSVVTTTTQTTTTTATITTSVATVTTTSTPVITATMTTVVQGESTTVYLALGVAAIAIIILLVVYRSSRSRTLERIE